MMLLTGRGLNGVLAECGITEKVTGSSKSKEVKGWRVTCIHLKVKHNAKNTQPQPKKPTFFALLLKKKKIIMMM